MSVPTTYTVPSTATYLTADGTDSRNFYAGDVIPMATAIRFGMPGAGYAAEQLPTRYEGNRWGVVPGMPSLTTRLQAAIDAVHAAGGGRLIFPPGTSRTACTSISAAAATRRSISAP
jgi:polygalacturonase